MVEECEVNCVKYFFFLSDGSSSAAHLESRPLRDQSHMLSCVANTSTTIFHFYCFLISIKTEEHTPYCALKWKIVYTDRAWILFFSLFIFALQCRVEKELFYFSQIKHHFYLYFLLSMLFWFLCRVTPELVLFSSRHWLKGWPPLTLSPHD